MRLLAISKNTFIETLRQPIYAVIIVFSLLLMLLAPAVSMYTLDEDIMLLRELGLSTLFLAGLFIAVFASTGAITEEIESGTITTVLSKPISRPTFVIGKFLGISMAVALSHLLITMALLMIVRHGTLETASDEIDWTVITAAGAGILATLIITIIASGLLLLALFALVALAILFSTRFNEVVTLTLCVGVFLLGLISDWVFGRFADQHIWAKIGSILTPNLQIFWVSDAIYETGTVPAAYLLLAITYSALYTAGILALAVAFFQRRQIG
ncbi:MAG: ABC transporter permease [Planctomycetota bacterium]